MYVENVDIKLNIYLNICLTAQKLVLSRKKIPEMNPKQ